jgi:hypothetical protein
MSRPLDPDDPTVRRMQQAIDDALQTSDAFLPERIPRKVGAFTDWEFKNYLKLKVKRGELTAGKDEIGRVWYSKPSTTSPDRHPQP